MHRLAREQRGQTILVNSQGCLPAAGTNAAIKTELRHVPMAARWYGTSMMRWKEGTSPLLACLGHVWPVRRCPLVGVKRASLARPRKVGCLPEPDIGRHPNLIAPPLKTLSCGPSVVRENCALPLQAHR